MLTVLALLATATTPVHSAEQNDLPPDCASADFTETGRPVMFPAHNGLSMGISAPRTSLTTGDPIVVLVWVNNQTDDEKALLSCSMWTEWGVDVYDSEWHRVKTQSEKKQEHNPAAKLHSDLQECFRNIALRIPPHSCSPLHDMGNVRVDLSKEYTLSPGSYFITQKKLTLPLSGLSVTVVDKNPADGDKPSP